MKLSEDIIIFSIFMSLEGLHAFSAFLPSIMTIGTFVDTPEKVVMIRRGEVTSIIFLGALVGSVGMLTKSWWPVLMGLMAGGVMLMVYEQALSHAPVFNGKGEEEV
jgi:hypothetical protein